MILFNNSQLYNLGHGEAKWLLDQWLLFFFFSPSDCDGETTLEKECICKRLTVMEAREFQPEGIKEGRMEVEESMDWRSS